MGKMVWNKALNKIIFIVIGFVFGLVVSVWAWVNPSQSPPLGGGVLQTDTSGLKIVTTTQITTGNFTVNNGNVGIGTTTPASKLSVSGGVSIGSSYAGIPALADGLIVEGQVGIGTANPGRSLWVFSPSIQEIAGFQGPNTNAYLSIRCTAGCSGDASLVLDDTIVGGEGNVSYVVRAKRLGFGTNGIRERIIIDKNGNMGIRTLTPTANLTIFRSDGGNFIELQNSTGSVFTIENDGGIAMVEKPFRVKKSDFPIVAGVNGGKNETDSTSHTVNLPSGISVGDLLIVFFVSDGNPTITFPSGWTQLFNVNNGSVVRFGAWYRIADGTEGSTINVTTSASEQSAHISYRIINYSGVPEAGTATTGFSSLPDPPTLTPSWGAKNTLWISAVGYDYYYTVSEYPTNYVGGRNDFANTTGGVGVGTAWRKLNASSEDPDVFNISANDQWVANVVAIAPSTNAGTSFLVVDSSGNVGIGTTNPGRQLTIVNSSSVGIQLVSTGAPSGMGAWALIAPSSGGFILQNDTNAAQGFQITSAGNFAFWGGNVGIGTTTPTALLHIASSTSARINLEKTGATANLSYITNDGELRIVSGRNLYLQSAAGMAIIFRKGTTEVMRIPWDSNNVGIGTTSPAYKLDVVGDIRTTGCLVYNGGTLGTCTSDIRLKDNITDLSFNNALAKVLSLQPKQFTLKNDPSQKISGLIAQEVEQFAPELVTTDEKGYKQIKYGDVQWLLIEAIKEQQKEIEELKAQILNSKY